jgi:hypothetical protein
MTLDQLIPRVARLFESKGYRYFTFGGVGVSLWGRPRTTHDLDVVLYLDRREVPGLLTELNKIGFRITQSHRRKLQEGRIIQLPIGRTELDIKLCAEGHDREALARAKTARCESFELSVASPEDIVLYKLQSWRTQDRADIENLLGNVSSLDRRYIGRNLAPIGKKTGYPMRRRWESIIHEA